MIFHYFPRFRVHATRVEVSKEHCHTPLGKMSSPSKFARGHSEHYKWNHFWIFVCSKFHKSFLQPASGNRIFIRACHPRQQLVTAFVWAIGVCQHPLHQMQKLTGDPSKKELLRGAPRSHSGNYGDLRGAQTNTFLLPGVGGFWSLGFHTTHHHFIAINKNLYSW